MKDARDAHGIIGYMNKYFIVIGSWHTESKTKAEIYDIKTDCWH